MIGNDDVDQRTDQSALEILDNNCKPVNVTLFCIEMKRDAAYYITSSLCVILLIISFVVVSIWITWTDFIWRFFVAFGCFMILCVIISEINHFNKFQYATAYFRKYRYTLVPIFCIVALADFILLELSDVQIDKCDFSGIDPTKTDCPLLNPEENGIRYITRILTITCGTLFILCVMAFWERVSYFSAHSDWVIAILYMSIIGAIFLYFARCLEPPNNRNDPYNWSWHQRRSFNKILSIIVKLMIFFVLFFVIMGAIVLALFGDASKASEDLGTWAAMLIFIILAHIIGVTPLAPGSVIDVCAGFLFVTLFVNNEGASIEAAFGVSLILTIGIHFSSSCAQYYVGKIPLVQIWANKTLPPEMLAASDSVLQTANWFKVGVVGQVFMDTANGLNQGRMNMKFCTQFWSEYASIPNAIGLVALGTVLAIPSFGETVSANYEWAEDAIPLVIMITTLWQMIASSWGAKELLASSGTVPYWTALEKWASVQYFYTLGYVPTKEGWLQDVYQVGSTKDVNHLSLFDIIQDYRITELDKSHIAATSVDWRKDQRSCTQFCKSLCAQPANVGKERKIIQEQKKLANHALKLREQHWERLDEDYLNDLVTKQYLEKTDPEVKILNFFNDSFGIKMIIHSVLVLLIFVTGLCSYIWIAKPIELSEAVQFGAKVLRNEYVAIQGWICLIIFWILIIIYYHREFINNIKETGDGLKYIFCGCKINNKIETVFVTPQWDNAPLEFQVFISKTHTANASPIKKKKQLPNDDNCAGNNHEEDDDQINEKSVLI